MGLFSDIFGGNKETHSDATTTERFSDGTSVTRHRDGSAKEYTRHETAGPLGVGEKLTVTYDGHGKQINTQEGWGKK